MRAGEAEPELLIQVAGLVVEKPPARQRVEEKQLAGGAGYVQQSVGHREMARRGAGPRKAGSPSNDCARTALPFIDAISRDTTSVVVFIHRLQRLELLTYGLAAAAAGSNVCCALPILDRLLFRLFRSLINGLIRRTQQPYSSADARPDQPTEAQALMGLLGSRIPGAGRASCKPGENAGRRAEPRPDQYMA